MTFLPIVPKLALDAPELVGSVVVGDGIGGGGKLFGDSEVDRFYAFFGDFRGLRIAGNVEYNEFRKSYGKAVGQAGYNEYFDKDANGAIGTPDYNEMRKPLLKQRLLWEE